MKSDFIVFLTFDIDSDFSLNTNDYYRRNELNFEGLEMGMPIISEILKDIPYTVFVRSDYQIKEIHGDYFYLFKKYSSIFEQIKKTNGELYWHNHLMEYTGNKWINITNNNLVSRFRDDYYSVKHNKYFNSKIVRIGECNMSNELMLEMSKNGILVDSSALPGRKRNDQEKQFDWSLTTNEIYSPSKNDYRVKGKNKLNIVEIPMTTIEMKTIYDKTPIKRYFNLSFRSDILFQNFETFVKNSNYLVTITHPFEILEKGDHNLLSYSSEVFQHNINRMVDIINKAGKTPIFCHIKDYKRACELC